MLCEEKHKIVFRKHIIEFEDLALNESFFPPCLLGASRWKLFALLNLLFFSCVLIAALLASFLFSPSLYSGSSLAVPEVFLGNWFVMILGIFFFNVVVSAFVVVTLPGFVFFPLSAAFLVYRAVLWGLLLCGLPTWLFLVVLPTLFLEGEAYVFAAAVGTVVGFSWLKPDTIYRGEALGRVGAFKKALKECLKVYVFVIVLLLVAAVVETATLILC